VKAQEFLERAKVEIGETVDATKVRFPKADAVALVRSKGDRVITLRGDVDLKNDPPDDDTLAAMILGPSGNLKAPTILVGKTLIVGFVVAAYEKFLTASDASAKRR
jgi:hypothetical protein